MKTQFHSVLSSGRVIRILLGVCVFEVLSPVMVAAQFVRVPGLEVLWHSSAMWFDPEDMPRVKFQDVGRPVFSISPEGRRVATAGYFLAPGDQYYTEGLINFRSLDGIMKSIWPYDELESQTYATVYSPDGRFVVSGGGTPYNGAPKQRIALRRTSDGKVKSVVYDDPGAGRSLPVVTALAISPDCKTLASCGGYSPVSIWRLPDLTLLTNLHGHSSGIRQLAFSPDGRLLASGSDDTTVKVWQVAGWRLLQTLDAGGPSGDLRAHSVTALAFSPDGTSLATGTWGGYFFWLADGRYYSYPARLKTWRVSNGNLLWSKTNINHQINALSFSQDGRVLATGYDHSGDEGNEANIYFVRTSDGTEVSSYWGGWEIDDDIQVSGPIVNLQFTDTDSKLLYGVGNVLVQAKTPMWVHEVSRQADRLILRWFGGTPPFQLERTGDLVHGPWENVGPPTTARSVTNIASVGTLFYRIQSLTNAP